MTKSKITCDFITENNIDLFSALTPEEKEQIDSQIKCKDFKKGQYIYKEGESPTELMFLYKGKVKIFKEGIGGREQIVRLSKPNGFIGYRALFAEETYNASAAVLEDSTIWIIDKNAIYKIIEQNSKFALKLIKTMASELGLSNTRTVTLTQKHIRGRLAESLLFLIETYGYLNDGVTINALLSREDLANLSNMTTSNAIRTLSSFASEGVVNLDGRKIKILDLKELTHISDLG
ncbi:Crp/Fnr family transcriptional regulator [Bacteroidota bacterium]